MMTAFRFPKALFTCLLFVASFIGIGEILISTNTPATLDYRSAYLTEKFGGIVHWNAANPIAAHFMLPGIVDAQSSQPLGPNGNIAWSIVATATNTNTLPALQMTTLTTGTPTVNTTYTTDTATHLCGLFPFVAARNALGYTWDWYLKNTAGSDLTITLAGGSGVTIVGTGTVAKNFVRHFKVNIAGCSGTPAATLYSLETTAF